MKLLKTVFIWVQSIREVSSASVVGKLWHEDNWGQNVKQAKLSEYDFCRLFFFVSVPPSTEHIIAGLTTIL